MILIFTLVKDGLVKGWGKANTNSRHLSKLLASFLPLLRTEHYTLNSLLASPFSINCHCIAKK